MDILLRAERLRRDKGKRACALHVDCLRHSLRKCPRLLKWPLFLKIRNPRLVRLCASVRVPFCTPQVAKGSRGVRG